MSSQSKKGIAEFHASEHFGQVQIKIQQFVLRGQDVNKEDLRNDVYNKPYDAKSTVHVVNILGYALQMPTVELNINAAEMENLLRTGDQCFIEGTSRKMLEKVIVKMKSLSFSLIPLIVVPDYTKPDKTFETLLIKVHMKHPLPCNYIDLTGRVYANFGLFLQNNKLPSAILCYPRDGSISIDSTGNINVECEKVGGGNAALKSLDIVTGIVGTVASVGAIAATGGLATPFMLASGGAAVVTTCRGIGKLTDASAHGMTVNPFKDAEARHHWLMIAGNLLSFTSIGVSRLARMESLTAAQANRLATAGRIVHGASATVRIVTIVDSVIYTANNWSSMSIHEKIRLTCAICFCFREIFSFANAERLIRESQIKGACEYFESRAESGTGPSFSANVRAMIVGNLDSIMKLIQELIRNNVDVTVNEDCTIIKIRRYEFKFKNIIRLEHFGKFLYVIQSIAGNFMGLFSLLRKCYGDESVLKVAIKYGDDLGGCKTDYATAMSELLQVFDVLFRLLNTIYTDVTSLTEAGLIIGTCNRFTIKSAFNIFVKMGTMKAIPLFRTLVELNPCEASRLNQRRSKDGTEEITLFKWITSTSTCSEEMLAKIRFLLHVDEICTDKSLRITELNPSTASIEIESIRWIDSKLFYQVKSAYRPQLIDPKFHRICGLVMNCHNQKLKQLWDTTCLLKDPADRSFEKLVVLEQVFQLYPNFVEKAVSFAIELQCTSFPQFVSLVLFALSSMERVMREQNSDPAATNHVDSLKSRYLECKSKAEELRLAGYCSIESTVESTQLLEAVKQLAGEGVLRFGIVENATLHLNENPMLRLKSEISKYNRFIAMKKFDREEVLSVGVDGGTRKSLILMENQLLQITVSVVENVGAYIDTFQFSLIN